MTMTKTQRQIFKGTLYALVAGCLWGVSGIFGQIFFSTFHGDALWVTSFRLIVAGFFLLFISAMQKPMNFFDIWKDKSNLPVFLVYTVFGVFSVQFSYYTCIQFSNSATATILQYISPVFILLYFAIFHHKFPKKKSIFWVFLAMIGVFLLITGGNVSKLSINPIALISGILAAIAVVFYSLAPFNLIAKYSAISVAGWGFLVAGIGSNIIHPVWQVNYKISIESIALVLGIAIVGTALAFLAWLQAIKYVSPLVATVAAATEPITSVLISIPLFGLKLNFVTGFAMVLVVVSVILLSKAEGEG
ncbi:drug/metabolite transporter (DMT)-like permease [Lactovum miscens]|uniref:Drug/metabolite transporter (DMT)-like permease n=2 Tax=Lactovum miscens TaxID=190387 RepID=A0A841C4K7_9LACT|nr:drug/metabolite transporter (DMT)-like permease [Lactovum miscens]